MASFVFCQLTYIVTDYLGNSWAVYRNLPQLEKLEFQTRVVSTIHALEGFLISVPIVLFDHEFRNDPVNVTNDTALWTFALGAG